MLRDRLTRDFEPRGDVARGAFLVGQEREHLAPARLGEHLEDVSGHDCKVTLAQAAACRF
jgi:hypothetical protein